MDIIKNYTDPEIAKHAYGENGAEIEYVDGVILVKGRKEKCDSLAVHADKLLGVKDAYKTTAMLKLKEGSKDTAFVISYKFTIEYLGLEYTMYDLGKTTLVTDKEYAILEHKFDIPGGATVLSVISYFFQQGQSQEFPDVYVKEFDIEEAEAVKTVSANRHTTPISRQKKMTFGAIRWDAYMETGKETSFVSDQVARALSPRQYHSMAPFFAKVTDMDKIEFGVADQEQFDKEALLAIKAGIDYFAYCWYRDDDPMSYARKQHLTSPHRDKIKMCTIVSANSLDEKSLKSLGKLMMEDCYLKFDNRPVVYVYDGFKVTYESLCRIEASAKEAGISEPPYFIGMADVPTPSILNEFVSKGIDAIGAYSCGVQKANEEYDVLASIAEEHNGQKYTYNEKIDIVPLVICGRDTRPRIENPVSWAGNYAGRYAKTPTGEQLYNHACRVFDRMLKEKDKNIPNTVLAYAWNEHDEGGWCCPTLAADSDGQPIIDENGSALMNCTMLNALQRALKEFREKENRE